MTNSAPNENILRLRELTDKMCSLTHENDYIEVIRKLKEIVDDGKEKISVSSSAQSKVKCYESMCSTIITILNKIQV